MQNKKISLVGPIRGRPNGLIRLIDTAMNLAKEPNKIEFCFYIDNDDYITKFTADNLNTKYANIKYIYGPKLSQSLMINSTVKLASADIIQFIADDLQFVKYGWDKIIRDEFEKYSDKIIMVFSPDGFQTDLATHCSIHKNTINTLGYAASPELTYVEFADTWLTFCFDKLNRKIKVEQLYEHMHPSAGKADMDMTYQTHLNPTSQHACAAQYYLLSDRREEDYRKLQKFIEEFKV